MKKLFMTMVSVLACGAAFALPVGNPSDASLLCDGLIWEGHCGDPCDPCLTMCDSWSIRVGFYGDYVFNRHMEVDHDASDHDHDIEHTEIYTNAGMIAFNVWDRFDIFATLGASTLYIDTNASAFGSAPQTLGRRVTLSTANAWTIASGRCCSVVVMRRGLCTPPTRSSSCCASEAAASWLTRRRCVTGLVLRRE